MVCIKRNIRKHMNARTTNERDNKKLRLECHWSQEQPADWCLGANTTVNP
jgi:hypothetical protein